jgi:hypothetical protein
MINFHILNTSLTLELTPGVAILEVCELLVSFVLERTLHLCMWWDASFGSIGNQFNLWATTWDLRMLISWLYAYQIDFAFQIT